MTPSSAAGIVWNLGDLYAKTQNYEQAAIWYRKAATAGDVGSAAALGDLYAKGHGVARDYAQAVSTYSTQQLAYQAALKVANNIEQTALQSFLSSSGL